MSDEKNMSEEKKKKNLVRPKIITFRLTEEEADTLRARAESAGCNLQNFIYKAVTDVPILNVEPIEAIYQEFRKSGVTLNQIAHSLNANREFDFSQTQAKIEEAIENHNKLEEEIWQSLKLLNLAAKKRKRKTLKE